MTSQCSLTQTKQRRKKFYSYSLKFLKSNTLGSQTTCPFDNAVPNSQVNQISAKKIVSAYSQWPY